jgi:hypothetical protein
MLALGVPDYGTFIPELALGVPDYGTVIPELALGVPDYGTVIPELALGVPDYGYSRNASCALNFICTRYFPVSFFKSSNLTQVCRIRFLFTEGSL